MVYIPYIMQMPQIQIYEYICSKIYEHSHYVGQRKICQFK